MKLLKAISEIISSKLILEISEKRILELINKYQKEKPDLSSDFIRQYIDRFEQIKNSPRVTQKDIYQLSWEELEKIVDASQKKDIKAGKIDVSIPDENLIYNKNNIRVYQAPDRKSCIKYGHGYNFCISARGGGESYEYYTRKGTPYFVFFDNLTKDDPNHLLVVFIYTKNKFSVTDAKNEEDKHFNSKDELISSYPQLKPVVDLFVPNENLTSLPDNLHVEGALDLSESPITSIGNNLSVRGSLNLNGTPITSIGDNLYVGGSLILGYCKNLTSLPDNLHVEGSLFLEGTPITSLPDNLHVGCDLDLIGSPITSLPDNLHVGRDLILKYCKNLTSLPDNLHVEGGLYLSDTQITSLPDNLHVGHLILSYCKNLTSLPDNLHVEGSLILRKTQITSLPDNLVVGGKISIYGTPLNDNDKLVKEYIAKGYKIFRDY